jgi:hypothetical protein
MLNILGTSFYNMKLVYILITHLKFKVVLKQVKQCVFVLLNAVCMHPVIKMYHICKQGKGKSVPLQARGAHRVPGS